MSFNTQQELIEKVLENLGGLPTGQTAAPEDVAKIKKALPGIVETLRVTEVFYLNSLDVIPAGTLQPLANVIAYALRSPFNVTDPDELNLLKESAAAGTAALKIMSRGRYTGGQVQTEWI